MYEKLRNNALQMILSLLRRVFYRALKTNDDTSDVKKKPHKAANF